MRRYLWKINWIYVSFFFCCSSSSSFSILSLFFFLVSDHKRTHAPFSVSTWKPFVSQLSKLHSIHFNSSWRWKKTWKIHWGPKNYVNTFVILLISSLLYEKLYFYSSFFNGLSLVKVFLRFYVEFCLLPWYTTTINSRNKMKKRQVRTSTFLLYITMSRIVI